MTNRLELNWKLDGFVDEQRYYCSDTPMDVNNLPAPKAIFAGSTRMYTDTDIVANQQYFIRVSAVKNGTEKVGEQIILDAKDYSKYTAYFRLIDFFDKNGGESLTAAGNAKIDNLAAYFDGAGDWLQRADASATTFGTMISPSNASLNVNVSVRTHQTKSWLIISLMAVAAGK